MKLAYGCKIGWPRFGQELLFLLLTGRQSEEIPQIDRTPIVRAKTRWLIDRLRILRTHVPQRNGSVASLTAPRVTLIILHISPPFRRHPNLSARAYSRG